MKQYAEKYIYNKNVCIIGAAQSIVGTNQEDYINSFDTIIRTNMPYPISNELKKDIGDKTDLIYHFLGRTSKLCENDIDILYKNNIKYIICPYPKDLILHNISTNERLKYLNEINKNKIPSDCIENDVYDKIRPHVIKDINTGLIAICDILHNQPNKLYATGFDFYRTGCTQGHGGQSPHGFFVWHDMESQIKHLKMVYKEYNNFYPDKILKGILEEK
jgi:hypothetical protein